MELTSRENSAEKETLDITQGDVKAMERQAMNSLIRLWIRRLADVEIRRIMLGSDNGVTSFEGARKRALEMESRLWEYHSEEGANERDAQVKLMGAYARDTMTPN